MRNMQPFPEEELTPEQRERYLNAYSLEADPKSPYFPIYAQKVMHRLSIAMARLPKKSGAYNDLFEKREELRNYVRMCRPRR